MSMEKKDTKDLWTQMQENKAKIIAYLRKRYSPIQKQPSEFQHAPVASSGYFDTSLREEDFEDIVYDAMITTYENREREKLNTELLKCELSTYLTRVCIYKANEKLRKNLKFDDFRKTYNNENTTGKINGKLIKQADRILGYCQESEYIQKETQSKVCEIVRNLPEPCYTILWFFYWEGLTLKELAEKTDKASESAVKVTKHRCMEKFGKRLKEVGYER